MIKKVNVLNDTHQLLQPEYLSHMTAENLQEAYRACPCHSRFYFGMEQLSSLPLDIKTQSTVLLIILVNTIRFNPVNLASESSSQKNHWTLLPFRWSLMKSELDLTVFHLNQHFAYSSYFNHHKPEETTFPATNSTVYLEYLLSVLHVCWGFEHHCWQFFIQVI